MKRSPADITESTRRITRRGLILGGTQLAFMGGLALRMRFMQVEEAEKYSLLAEENRINLRLLPPARGLIFDRNGATLAENEQNYRIVLVREDAGDVDDVLARLSRFVALDPDDLEKARKEIFRRSPFVPVTIADRLTWEEFAEVAVNGPALPGVTPEVGFSRVYPLGGDFAHLVGYVGPVSDFDLTRGYLASDEDPLLQIPRFQVGKSGVEARLEHGLRGQAGNKQIEVNAVGRVMRELGRTEGTPGANLQLTVDSMLQNYMQVRLLADTASQSASAALIDIENGDILAVASGPSFDPNKFVRGISNTDYQALQDEQLRPQFSKATQGAYPPGSTFKMVTALAALEDGVIELDETVYCPGFRELGDRKFHCWNRGGHGKVDLITSLEQSCDVYYYDIAERVGIEKISAMARRLGLGQRFDLPITGLHPGLTPTKAWKREHRDEDWLIGDTLNSGIGQGFVLATPLQLAVMAARLATGQAVLPRLVKSVDGVEEPVAAAAPLGLTTSILQEIRRGMFRVVNRRSGTAYSSRIVAEGMEMAGKTGTSQVRNVVVRNEDVPWNQRDHALFVCYAPFDKPRYACSVVVEHGGGGSLVAAPVARDIMLQALYGGKPPLAAYPTAQRGRIQTQQQKLALRDPASFAPGANRL
ncbi:Penicillin-binding protein 2 (PBP-2) [Candidatus Rhodobacter oscarellae]|uniref:Penicillin-binding protein 2 (PBP-2) n=1 Tax=Candidatus Rhodobacter oscarellae TaxID=1675527 RepID=A0A0J9EDL6_9RHOB|nr:penicillin-binding protein 2 [Candidatus Rhodobacter lobularis]KMW59824.1 Penicillin-binding protein 2 (PBP-2) [Candidatus Rhodobacter lobularis]